MGVEQCQKQARRVPPGGGLLSDSFYEQLVEDVASRVAEMVVAPEPSLLVTSVEAGRMLSVSSRTVLRMISSGLLQEVDLREFNGDQKRRTHYLRRADVEDFVRSR